MICLIQYKYDPIWLAHHSHKSSAKGDSLYCVFLFHGEILYGAIIWKNVSQCWVILMQQKTPFTSNIEFKVRIGVLVWRSLPISPMRLASKFGLDTRWWRVRIVVLVWRSLPISPMRLASKLFVIDSSVLTLSHSFPIMSRSKILFIFIIIEWFYYDRWMTNDEWRGRE